MSIWSTVAGGITSLLGGSKQSKGAEKAAAAQLAGTREGIASQEKMFERSLELQAPYREAGYAAIEGLQGLTTPEGRAQSLQDYYAGPEFLQMSQQIEEQQLRNAAATGGLRGGVNQAALATIAPQLGQQFLAGQEQRFTGLSNLGMGAASQGAAGAQQLGGNVSLLQQQGAQAQAANQLAQASIFSNTLGTLEGLGADYLKNR